MHAPIQILLVEDRDDDAELVTLELETAGLDFNLVRVDNRHEYIAKLTDEVDIVLADYNLPQFSAPEALELLKSYHPDIPFIVVTGSISEEVAVDCMKRGAADYLIKDRLSRLGGAVRHALDQRDLRRAKTQAERTLQIMDRAIASSITAVVLADLDGNITYANDALLKLWQLRSLDQVIGESISTFWDSGEDDPLHLLNQIHEEKSVKGEIKRVNPDSSPVYIQYSASVVYDSEHLPQCILGIFFDVTEQKLAEDARREAEILRIALEKERELRELKSRFTSMVIHDFRNPINSILLSLTTVLKYGDHLDSKRRDQKILLAIDQVRHLNQLLDDVLMIGKMDVMAAEFEPVEQDLHEFCALIYDEYVQVLLDDYSLNFISDARPLIYRFDPYLMRRAVNNLLSNAIKYSPDGGHIDFELHDTGEAVVMRVSDHGIGIPKADQARLFDGFHRASNVGAIQGTGLGLAIVKQVIELHNGTIHVRSEEGQGTTFTVIMPVYHVMFNGNHG